MADKKLPPAPFGKTCETCTFWIASEREKYYPTEQGSLIPVSKVSIAGMPHGSRMLGQGQVELAPCAVAPMWAHTRADHWCWQHPAAADTTFAAQDEFKPLAHRSNWPQEKS